MKTLILKVYKFHIYISFILSNIFPCAGGLCRVRGAPAICIMVYFMLYTSYVWLVMVGLLIVMSCHLWFIFQLDYVIIHPPPSPSLSVCPLHFKFIQIFENY